MGLGWAWCPHLEQFRERSNSFNLHPAAVRKTWKQGGIPDQASFGKVRKSGRKMHKKRAVWEMFCPKFRLGWLMGGFPALCEQTSTKGQEFHKILECFGLEMTLKLSLGRDTSH